MELNTPAIIVVVVVVVCMCVCSLEMEINTLVVEETPAQKLLCSWNLISSNFERSEALVVLLELFHGCCWDTALPGQHKSQSVWKALNKPKRAFSSLAGQQESKVTKFCCEFILLHHEPIVIAIISLDNATICKC